MNSIDTLKLFEIVSDYTARETDRGWRRFSIMLTVNAGLIALISIGSKNHLWQFTYVLVGILGIILSYIWYKIMPNVTYGAT